MRRLWTFGLCAVALAACARAVPSTADPRLKDRPYALSVPETGQGVPLAVLLHGYGGNGEDFAQRTGLRAALRARGWVVAAPSGTVDSQGRRFWNATDACCNLDHSKVDDVAYLDAVLDDAQAQAKKAGHAVDPKRIFLVGYSNGGFLAHRYACERPGKVAAVVSLAGAAPTSCASSGPVAVLQIHGDADEVVRPSGGRVFDDPRLGAYPSVEETVAGWAARLGCSGKSSAPNALDLDRKSGAETTRTTFTGCTNGSAVELWRIGGVGHYLPWSAELVGGVADFLAAHPGR